MVASQVASRRRRVKPEATSEFLDSQLVGRVEKSEKRKAKGQKPSSLLGELSRETKALTSLSSIQLPLSFGQRRHTTTPRHDGHALSFLRLRLLLLLLGNSFRQSTQALSSSFCLSASTKLTPHTHTAKLMGTSRSSQQLKCHR